MRTSRLWQALDVLGGAAPQRDWAQALGEHWAIAGALLRRAGDIAEELICPRSSENGCVRHVVKMPGGKLRAECGDTPQRCDRLSLQLDEIRILTIDGSKLAKAIVVALDLHDPTTPSSGDAVQRLGRYEIRAGVGFPVFLALPEQGGALTLKDITCVTAPPGPKALLLPYPSATGPEIAAFLDAANVHVFHLDDVVIWDARRTLGPRYETRDLFRAIIETLPGVSTETPPAPEVNLPPGTQWSSITMNFDTPEVIDFHGPGIHRKISPADLGMAKQRSAEVKVQWTWLVTLAKHGGRIPIGKASVQKQKQFVSERLRAFTGIDDDPIESEGGYYVAKFRLTNSLKQGRADQRDRNFADDN